MLLTIYLHIDFQSAFVGLFHEKIIRDPGILSCFCTCCSLLVDIPGPPLVVEKEPSGGSCPQTTHTLPGRWFSKVLLQSA